MTALKASFALPGIFRPVQINGRWLIDGALVNPIPVSVCRALGARIVIAVNLSSDLLSKGGIIHDQAAFAEACPPSRKTDLLGTNGRAARASAASADFRPQQGAPGMSAVMMDAINITQDRIARSRLAGDPPDITIGPKTGGIGLFDFHRAGEAIELGARATEKQIEEIKQRGASARRLNALSRWRYIRASQRLPSPPPRSASSPHRRSIPARTAVPVRPRACAESGARSFRP